MEEHERFSIATRLYVRLRRLGGPVIDPLRMTRDDDYVREVVQQLAGTSGDEEVVRMAARLDAILNRMGTGLAPPRQTAPLPAREPEPTPTPQEPDPVITARYVGALR